MNLLNKTPSTPVFYLLFWISISCLPVACWSLEIDQQYSVKAAFLYKFTLFVHWDKDKAKKKPGPLIMCLIQPEPFGDKMEDVIQAHTSRVETRPVNVERLSLSDDNEHCHVMFISSQAEIPTQVGPNTLLITENRSTKKNNAHISLFIERTGHLAFEINQENLKNTYIQIEYKLLIRSKDYPERL